MPVPDIPTPVSTKLPPFNTEELVRRQRSLRKRAPQSRPSAKKAQNGVEYSTTILEDNEYLAEAVFHPGTFVETRRAGEVSEGVILSVRHTRGWEAMVLGPTGIVNAEKFTDVHFAIPFFISSDHAERCGDGSAPENDVQINARVEVLRQIRSFTVQVETAIQGWHMWDRHPLENFYDQVKAKDPNAWGELSLKKATALLYVNPTFINYYATHKYLADRPLRYVAHDGYYRSQVFHVRPERDVREILEVDRLIQEHREKPGRGKYFKFVEKAKKKLSSLNTDPQLLPAGPMTQHTNEILWNDNDQLFLRFLLRSQLVRRTNQLDPYRLGNQVMMHDIMSFAAIEDGAYHEVLVKLGVIAPWQSYSTLLPAVNPTGDFPPSEDSGSASSKILQKSQRVSGTVLGPYDLHATDPLESVRQDFHGTVFVIDDPTAEELDDGVSVERIPSEPDNIWAHVHVADPARYLHPGHALSIHARKRCESIYLVDRSYPMLPKELTHNFDSPLSLTGSRDGQEPSRVLTFSIKLDGAGTILDYKLQASILRNVRKISYDEVDRMLGLEPEEIWRPLGGVRRPEPAAEPLTPEEIADLRLLNEVKNIQDQLKFKQNVILATRYTAAAKLLTPIPATIQSPCMPGATYSGFPEIDYTVEPGGYFGSRSIVSNMMTLAGRVASCIGRDNDVPLIRRGMAPLVFDDGDNESRVLAARRRNCIVFNQTIVRYPPVAFPTGTTSTELLEHAGLGIPAHDGYSRITSPLRRFTDLLGHWQMHHILLGSKAPRRMPFDKREMETLARESSVKQRDIRSLETVDHTFWTILALKRFANTASVNGLSMLSLSAHHPWSSLDAFVLYWPFEYNLSVSVVVRIPSLGVNAFVENGAMDAYPGQDIKVEIISIEMGRFPRVFVKQL